MPILVVDNVKEGKMNANGTKLKESQGAPLSVLHCQEALDRSNYEMLVSAAREEIEHGATRILVDMTETEIVSLAGAIGLYVVAELSEGESGPVGALIHGVAIDQVDGWALIRRLRDSIQEGSVYPRMLIVAHKQKLLRSLHELGLSRLMCVLPSLDDAMKVSAAASNGRCC
jgi:hypothetical protein